MEDYECGSCDRMLTEADAEEVSDGRLQVKCDCGNIVVECPKCNEFVSVMKAASGLGGRPVHYECFGDEDRRSQ